MKQQHTKSINQLTATLVVVLLVSCCYLSLINIRQTEAASSSPESTKQTAIKQQKISPVPLINAAQQSHDESQKLSQKSDDQVKEELSVDESSSSSSSSKGSVPISENSRSDQKESSRLGSGLSKASNSNADTTSNSASASSDSSLNSNNYEYVQIKPEEIGMNEDEKSLIDSMVNLASQGSSSSENNNGQQDLIAEHKAADDELNAHLAQDSLSQQETSLNRAYGAPSQGHGAAAASRALRYADPRPGSASRPTGSYPIAREPARQHIMSPQAHGSYGPRPIQAAGHMLKNKLVGPHNHHQSQHQQQHYGPSSTMMSATYSPISNGHLPRHLPRGAAAGYAAFRDFVRARAIKFKQQNPHATGGIGYPSNIGPVVAAPLGPAPVPMPVLQAQVPGHAHQAQYPSPGPPAAGSEPNYGYIQQHQSAAGYPAASPPPPPPASYLPAALGNPASASGYQSATGAEPNGQHQESQSLDGQYKSAHTKKVQPNKVTIAQAFIPHMASPGPVAYASPAPADPAAATAPVYGGAPSLVGSGYPTQSASYSATNSQQQQPSYESSTGYHQNNVSPGAGNNKPAGASNQQQAYTNAILSKLYGGEHGVSSAAGKPEYSKDFGMVIHYPQATVYTEPMSIDQLHKLTGSGISQVLEQVQQNLANGYREDGNTIRANNVHHLGHGVTLSSKEYYAPDKTGQYVPTTAALISAGPIASAPASSYQAPATETSYGPSAGLIVEPNASYAGRGAELGPGYERVRQAVAASLNKYESSNAGSPAKGTGANRYENSNQSRYKGLLAISNIIDAELKALYKNNNQQQPSASANQQSNGGYAKKSIGHHEAPRPKSYGPAAGGHHQPRAPHALRPYSAAAGPYGTSQKQRGPRGGNRYHSNAPQQIHPMMYHRPSHVPRNNQVRYPQGDYSSHSNKQASKYAGQQQAHHNNKQSKGYRQQQHQQHQYLALEKQMVQLLKDLRTGDEQYSGKNQPPKITSQGYPDKVMQKYLKNQQTATAQYPSQNNVSPASLYSQHEGIEISQGPNDQIGEIADLIESLKGALEANKPSSEEAYQQPKQQQPQQQASISPYKQVAQQQAPKPEEVRYIASALAQQPSYSLHVPVSQVDIPIVGPTQTAEQSNYGAKQNQQQEPSYNQAAPVAVSHQQYDQGPIATRSTYQSLTMQFQQPIRAATPIDSYQPKVPQDQRHQHQVSIPQQVADTALNSLYQNQASSATHSGAPEPYSPAPFQQQAAIQGDNIPYVPVQQQQQAGPYEQSQPEQQQRHYQSLSQVQSHAQPQQTNEHQPQQQTYQAPIQLDQHQLQHDYQSPVPSSPATELAQNVVAGSYPNDNNKQAHTYNEQSITTSEHSSIINHLVPVAVSPAPIQAHSQQQAYPSEGSAQTDSSYQNGAPAIANQQQAYQQAEAAPTPTSSAAIPLNQIAIAAPNESHYNNAQSLSSLVNYLPTEYQDLLRHPVSTAQLIDAAHHPSVAEVTGGSSSTASQHDNHNNYQTAASNQIQVRLPSMANESTSSSSSAKKQASVSSEKVTLDSSESLASSASGQHEQKSSYQPAQLSLKSQLAASHSAATVSSSNKQSNQQNGHHQQ